MTLANEPRDPLSDVLSLLRPRSAISAALDAGGEWSIQFPQDSVIRFQAVISGDCWLSVDGVADAVLLNPGDCFLLASGRPFRLASNLSLPAVDAYPLFYAKEDGIALCGTGGDLFAVGALFTLASQQAGILLGMLPPIVHIRGEDNQGVLRWCLERLVQEQRSLQLGGVLLAQHLAHIMLIQALRVYLAEGVKGGVGWLFALADQQLCAAINAMHADPARRWTLQSLAHIAGMSRTVFALKFKAIVGQSAIDYLTRWRMLLAGDRLERSADPVSEIALSLGYESESAFGVAFRRSMGCSPRQYARRRKSDDYLLGEADSTQNIRSAVLSIANV